MQANKLELKQHTYSQRKSKLRFAILWGGGAKTNPRCVATEWEVGTGLGSCMGRRRVLKMSESASSTKIWRWMQWHAMTEPPRTLRNKKVIERKTTKNERNIIESERLNFEAAKYKPAPQCQSMTMLLLSVRAERRMEKISWRLSRAPLHCTPSSLITWFLSSVVG